MAKFKFVLIVSLALAWRFSSAFCQKISDESTALATHSYQKAGFPYSYSEYMQEYLRLPSGVGLLEELPRILVAVQFSEKGKVSKLKVLNNGHKKIFEQEAVRFLNTLPLVEAAMCNDKPITSQDTLTVDFTIFYGNTMASASGLAEPTHSELVTDNYIYALVEQAPTSPYDMQQYIKANLKYPTAEWSAKQDGIAYVACVVEKDGALTNVVLEKTQNLTSEMSKEAIRVVKSLPKIHPARSNGVVVRSRYIIPVRFSVD